MIRDWFRSKRALIAERNAWKAKAELQMLRNAEARDSAEKVINQQEQQLAEYDRALTALSASFDRSRIRKELADEIAQETAWKRRSDL